jgi:L-fucose isomerase-like protein
MNTTTTTTSTTSNCATLRPRVGAASVFSPLEVGADRAPQAAADFARVLESIGCEVVPLGPIDGPARATDAGQILAANRVDAVALVAVSWYEDYLVLDMLEEYRAPVLLWSLPGMETGALCGSQQLAAYLQQLAWPYACVFGEFSDVASRRRAENFLRAAALHRRLRRARVGCAGTRCHGMTEVAASEIALKKALGPRVVPLDAGRLLQRAREVPDAAVLSLWQEARARAARCTVQQAEGLAALKFLVAIREAIATHRLDALTVGCYPHMMGVPCLPAALLADEGIPLGCEGDVNGVIGQQILTLLSGQPTHNTDWLEPLEDGTVVFTHCGSGSFTLAEAREQITLAPVRLMERGVCVLFPAKPGPVTLLNLLPRGTGYQVALLQGEALSTGMVFPGNPLRVRFEQPTPQLIDWIFAEGVGHHWMVGYGHLGEPLREWAKLCGPDLRLLEP